MQLLEQFRVALKSLSAYRAFNAFFGTISQPGLRASCADHASGRSHEGAYRGIEDDHVVVPESSLLSS